MFGSYKDVTELVYRLRGLTKTGAVLHIGAGVAGIHGVMVRPEARGKGLGRTLTLLALNAAREVGLSRRPQSPHHCCQSA